MIISRSSLHLLRISHIKRSVCMHVIWLYLKIAKREFIINNTKINLFLIFFFLYSFSLFIFLFFIILYFILWFSFFSHTAAQCWYFLMSQAFWDCPTLCPKLSHTMSQMSQTCPRHVPYQHCLHMGFMLGKSSLEIFLSKLRFLLFFNFWSY
jgi:hypothetical protein